MSIEAMRQALDWIEGNGKYEDGDSIATALRQAIEQAEKQEPVAYGMPDTQLGKSNRMMMVRLDKGQDGCTVPLYTSAPSRHLLTDEQCEYCKRGLRTMCICGIKGEA